MTLQTSLEDLNDFENKIHADLRKIEEFSKIENRELKEFFFQILKKEKGLLKQFKSP